MRKAEIKNTLTIYEDFSELPKDIQELFKAAEEIREKAYTPYSKYKVGAALRLESGRIITGNNQENAAYPSGLCAERTAIFYAGAHYPKESILSMAITVNSPSAPLKVPAAPCGACRQAIAEYEFKQKEDIAIYLSAQGGEVYKVASLKAILPLAFNGDFL